MSWTGIDWTPEFPRFLADVTGDGYPDIVGFGLNGVWVSRNDGRGGFLPPELGLADLGFNQSWRIERHVRATGQFGGRPIPIVVEPLTPTPLVGGGPDTTGRIVVLSHERRAPGADVIGFGDAGVWIALSHGDGQFGRNAFVVDDLGYNQGWRVDQHPRMLVDLNGDGLSDIVAFGNDGVWTVLCAGQPAADTAAVGPARFVLANLGYNQGWRVDQHPRLMADLTGDRCADIVGFGNDGVWTALGLGDGGFADARFVIADFGFNQGWRTDVHERLLGDLTGDGKADFVGFGNDGVWTAVGNDDGSFAPARLVLGNLGANQGWRTDQHPRFLIDLTGNGHADVVGFGNDGVWTALGNGDGTFQDARFVLANLGVNQGWAVQDHPRVLVDTNGDGRPDIVGFGNAGVWVAVNNGDGTFADAQFVLADFGLRSGETQIKHVFVLMLENRSFDHFLGFSGLAGTDTLTGQPTTADGLKGDETNDYETVRSTVSQTATDRIDPGPPHNFNDVLISLCGPQFDNVQLNGGSYPPLVATSDQTGYAAAFGIVTDANSSGEPMRCFSPGNLQVLNALAWEFVVCDRWFSAMAGPTEPNRMFVHAANSGNWDDSPSAFDQALAEIAGVDISFQNGTIYDRLREANLPFRIYAGDEFPNVGLLHGVSIYTDVDGFDDFEGDINDDEFDAAYTFIEPDYDVVNPFEEQFHDGNSQHPPGSVADGERLIKQVYEIIRSSPRWNESLLVVTWDEHGGFFDHVLPPRAPPTGLRGQTHGYMFDQLGPRVPAVVISPLIPKNMVEHRTLEHSVIPATVEQLFGLPPMTVRDANLIGLQTLATLTTPRADTPLTLPDAVTAPAVAPRQAPLDPGFLLSDVRDRCLVNTMLSAYKAHVEAMPDQAGPLKARLAAMRTVGDLQAYLAEIAPMVTAKRTEGRNQRVAAWRARFLGRSHPVLPNIPVRPPSKLS